MEELKSAKRPWHLWVVAILGILWYVSGAITIFMAQAGRLQNMRPDEVEYYANQPLWFVLLTDISLISAVIASLALIFKPRVAFLLFAVSLTSIVITNVYDLLAGTSRALANSVALVVTGIIIAIAVFMLIYSRFINKRITTMRSPLVNRE